VDVESFKIQFAVPTKPKVIIVCHSKSHKNSFSVKAHKLVAHLIWLGHNRQTQIFARTFTGLEKKNNELAMLESKGHHNFRSTVQETEGEQCRYCS